MNKLYLFVAILLMAGCKALPPAPANTHWGTRFSIGDQLYCDKNGEEVASVISDQSCVFKGGRCMHFEKNEQALKYAVDNAHCDGEGTRQETLR